MKNTIYDVQYFIDKFEAIPERNWFTGRLRNEDNSKRCALGHCCPEHNLGYFVEGKGQTDESKALILVFSKNSLSIGMVNDGKEVDYQQPTAKKRILAALYDIKKMQQPVIEPVRNDITKSLAVLPVDETSDTITKRELITLPLPAGGGEKN